MCSLMMIDESREWLDLRASYGAGDAYIKKPRLAMGESLLGVVARLKKPMQVPNVQASNRYQNIEVARQEGLISLLSVPLLFAGQPIGTLNVYTGRPYNFSNEEIRILSALAELSAIAIEKARLYERIVDVEEQLRQNEKLSALGLLAAEVAVRVLCKLLAEYQDAVERRAQLVRHVGEEFGFVLGGEGEFLGFLLERAASLLDLLILAFDFGVLFRELLRLLGELLVRLLQFFLLGLELDGELLRLLEQAFGLHGGFDTVEHDADAGRELLEEGEVGGGEGVEAGEFDDSFHAIFEEYGQHDDVARDCFEEAGADGNGV